MKKTLLCFLFLFTTTFYAQLSYITVCSGESFNLTSQNSVFIGSLDPATPVTYFLTLDDALNNTNEIPNPTNYYGPVGSNKIYGRLNNNGTYIINHFNLTVYQRVTATATHLPISCKGGLSTITVNAFPGATYYYSLNGGALTTNRIFTNVPAGVYNIRVQSPNPICPDATFSYTVTEPTAITAVSTTSGQTVTVTAAGGTAPYQYSKDGTTYQSSTIFSGLPSGNYNFRVKDSKGCSYVMPVINIPGTGGFAATAVISKSLDCISGATIVANATGGQAPYVYSINGGATYQSSNTFANILTGTFTIRVRDAVNTISISNPVTITSPAAINATIASTIPDCVNNFSTITVTATGGQAPYLYSRDNGSTYNASNVFTNVFPGTYRIIVKDSKGCVSPSVNTTIQPYSPLVIAASNTSILCNGDTASLTISASGGKGPYQYSVNNGTTYTSSNTYSALTAGTYSIKVKDALGCVSTINHVINQPPTVLTAVLSTSGPNITLTTSGGTAPYQYSLDGGPSQTSNVFTVLTSGNYTVQVRDFNGCTRTFVTAVVVPYPLTSSTIITKESDCFSGASIMVNATGGQPPYLYSINGISYQTANTFVNIPPGMYTVKVKDFANTISNSNPILVTAPSTVTATTLVTATDCTNKATIRVQAIGGQPPYIYSVNGGVYTTSDTFYNVSPGTYAITVKDNKGCTSSAVATTIQSLVPLVLTASNTPILCNGETSVLSINTTGGQAPYEYAINNGVYTNSNTFNSLNAGTYAIKVRDAIGCISELEYTITEPNALTATSVTFGQNIVITTNGGKEPYQYSLDGINYQESNVFLDTTSGTYTVTVKDSQGCSFALIVKLEPAEQPLSSGVMAVKLIDCRGNGALRVIGYGGKPPYEYSIDGALTFQTSDTFNDLIAGTYPVAVRDTENTVINNISMELRPFIPVTGSAIVTNSTGCLNNGTIEISANGGQISYYYSIDGGQTYSPNNTFSNLAAGNYTIFVKDSQDCISPAISATIEAPSPLVITASHISLCYGGTASLTINANGGQAPYEYSINNVVYTAGNTFTDLYAGPYTVKVRDALGCSSELNYVITEPTALTASTNIEAQTVTVIGSGGTPPFSYSADNVNFQPGNIFTDLTPGSHDFFVKDANGCQSSSNATIAAPLSFTTSIIKQADCSGKAQIFVTAAGGQAPYSYSLSYTMSGTFYQSGNIFSKVPPGTYYLTVKDALNAVSSTNPIVISQPVAVNATATNTAILCAGETASLTITATSGEAPFEYAIDNGLYTNSNTFTNLKAGTYTLNVKDVNSCLVSLPYTITEPIAVSATINTEGQTLTINGIGGTAPYQYSLDSVSFQSQNVFTNLNSGLYNIFVKDANGCGSTPLNVTIADPIPLTSTAAITKPLNCGVKATITVTAAGGIAPYQYSIDGGITYKSANVFTTLNAGTYNAVVKDAANTISNTTTIVIDPLIPLVLDIVITKPLDCTGTATVKATVTGGVAPYLYAIDSGSYSPVNTFNLYAARTYIVKILDNAGCIVTKPITIAPYTPTIISTVVTNVSCNGNNNGLIRVTASSGMAPYTYSIGSGYQTGNTFSNLAPGNYTVSVKDNQGCIVTKPEVITQPTALASTINITNATCFNSATGTVTVNASGGTSPYTYSINDITYSTNKTFNNLIAGVYNVSVKDSKGCSMSYYTTITQPNPLVINLTKTDINCYGSVDGSIVATATGGNAPYTYSLNNSAYSSSNIFNNLVAGQYNVTVKDVTGCATMSTITIEQPTPLFSSASVINPSYNSNDGRITVTASGGIPPYLYSLKNSNGTTVFPQQNFNIFTNLVSGSYNVQVTDSRGCTFLQSEVNLISPPPIVAMASVTPLTCNSDGVITVTAVGGTAPYQYSFDNGATYTVSNVFSTFMPGNYTIIVRDAQNNTTSIVAVIDAVNPLNTIATIVSPITCSQDGTITAIVNGGQAPYVYSLNGGPFQTSNIFIVYAGVHTISVRDSNGCTAISAVEMTPPQALVASSTVENQTVTITAIGGSGNYRYAVSPDLNLFSTSNTFTNLEAGDHTAIVQDLNGCYVILSFVINPPAPVVEGKEAITVDFKPGATLADLVVEGENIKWYSSPNPSETKTSKTNETPLPLTTVLVDGTTYYASQTINGVESKNRLAVTAKLNGTLSTSNFVLPNFKFYPNPILHNLTISNTSVIDEVEIYSASGITVLAKKIDSDQAEIDLSNVSSGFYFLKVKSEGQTKTIKILKK